MTDIQIDPATLRGTPGFFRVGKSTAGRWWMIDPDNQPMLFKGVCGINRAGTPGGRLAKPGPYQETIDRKFGTDPQPFVRDVIERLREHGFNAAGSWVTEEFFDQGLPYTEILECNKLLESARMRAPGLNLPDVFDLDWRSAVDNQASKLCQPRRDSRNLVGYFTDNELGWGQPRTEAMWGAGDMVNQTDAHTTLLQACMCLDPQRPAAREAWRFALQRHANDRDQLANAWGIERAVLDDLARRTDQGFVLNHPHYARDHEAFSLHFANLYFQVTHDAIRRYDPNHLILGCRFGAPPGPAVLKACTGPHCDLISANNYRDNFYERVDAYYQSTGEPILNGEFAWASDYFKRHPLPDEPDGFTETDRVRVRGREALERAFTHPGLVGYTWYRWVHRFTDPDQPHYGFVAAATDEVNRFNAQLLKHVHPRLDAIATGTLQPATLAIEPRQ